MNETPVNIDTLLREVREENLSKAQLEDYHLALSGVYADLMLEQAALEKEKAMYLFQKGTQRDDTGKPLPDVKVRRLWDATENGQRLIDVKAYAKATSQQLRSLKSRLYSQY